MKSLKKTKQTKKTPGFPGLCLCDDMKRASMTNMQITNEEGEGWGVHSRTSTQQKCKLPHWSFTVNLSMKAAVKWMTHRSWDVFTLLLVRVQTMSHNFKKLVLEVVIMISRLSGCLAERCWTIMIKATNHENTIRSFCYWIHFHLTWTDALHFHDAKNHK